MKCTELIEKLGFDCLPLPSGALRLWSPFTYGDDGEMISLYVEPTSSGFIVTDNAESLMHAASMGIKINKAKLLALHRASGRDVTIGESGEISSKATEETLSSAVVSVLNASIAVSHFESSWLPKTRSDAFNDAVGRVLDEEVKDQIQRNVLVTGASGHQIQIPFAIRADHHSTYIQPVAYGHERVEWKNVYRGLGVMLDLKNAGTEDESRAIVIEDTEQDVEIQKAVTLLSIAANVVYFSKLRQWAANYNRR